MYRSTQGFLVIKEVPIMDGRYECVLPIIRWELISVV